MSQDPMSLMLYSSAPHPCSYLDNLEAVTAFVDPNVALQQATYDQLINLGFRRSGVHIYMPYCKGCNACISVRIPVAAFNMSRSFKRIMRANQDLNIEVINQAAVNRDEHYQLYEAYINNRHEDGDMFPANREQYDKFLFAPWCNVRFIEMRQQGRLVGAAVTDYMASGLSALYTYFDHQQSKRSLGTFAILNQIRLTQELQLPYLYLGYYVKASKKMAYKARFSPLEGFQDDGWTLLE